MVRGWQKVPWILQWILAHAAAFAIASGMSFAMVADGNFNDVLWVLFLSALFSGGCSGSVEAGLLRRMLRYPGWWVAATIFATPLGVALGAIAVAAGLDRSDTLGGPILFGIIFGTSVGAVVGAAQWFSLQSHMKDAWLWIIFSAIGRGLGWALGWTVGEAANFPTVGLSAAFGGCLGGIIYGAITGSCFLRLRMKKRDS